MSGKINLIDYRDWLYDQIYISVTKRNSQASIHVYRN